MIKFTFFTLLVAVFCVGCTYDNEEDLGIKVPGNLAETVSYSAKIRPIMTNYCTIAGCHSASNKLSIPDFSVDKNVFNYSEEIDEQIRNGNMPRGSKLTYDQKDLILSWIKQGAKNN